MKEMDEKCPKCGSKIQKIGKHGEYHCLRCFTIGRIIFKR